MLRKAKGKKVWSYYAQINVPRKCLLILKKQKTYSIPRCQIHPFRTIDNKIQRKKLLLKIDYKIYVDNICSFGISITERLLFQFC